MADENVDISKNPAFVQLTGLVTQLGKNFQTLQGLIANQGANLDKVVKAIGDSGGKPPANKDKKDETPPPSDKDLEEMSQPQLVAHIFKSMRGMLDGFGKELNTKIDGLSTTFEKKELGTEVERAKGAHKDFDDWIPEIREMMTNNPNLKIEQAYTLVRSGNAEKSKQMDEKYKVGLEDDKTKDKQPAFGGLMPTSGSHRETNDDGTPKKALTQGQAGDKAWEVVFGENPALAGADSED
jgi:hypothetical protein